MKHHTLLQLVLSIAIVSLWLVACGTPAAPTTVSVPPTSSVAVLSTPTPVPPTATLALTATSASTPKPLVPKVGKWAGKPSVALEIVQGNKIKSFQITVPYPPSTCTLDAREIPIQADGTLTMTWSIPELGGAFESTLRGKVENDSRLTGTFSVQSCGNSIQSPASKGSWSATWKNP